MLSGKVMCATGGLLLAAVSHVGAVCPWDCDADDGVVGINDFLALLAQWGGTGSCDFDGGGVGINDFLELLANWGPCAVGACCDPGNGGCMVLLPADCGASGGVYGGDGTDCTDSDADRIPDAFELDDCLQAAGACFAGTDPLDPDTDDDGIDDGDELYGTLGGLDLPGMGLNPCHKDLLIEADRVYSGAQLPDRNLLHANQVNRLVASFAAGGMANPDGVTGITLHLDQGQPPYGGGNAVLDPANNTMVDVNASFNGGEYFTIKAANFAGNRNGYFHYCLLADSYSINGSFVNSSGLAELPGDDYIVSMGQWVLGDDNRIGNIFLHELGHNLDLRHGGFENRNYKPNYNSVMNYGYAFCGADGDADAIPDDLANYSHGVNIPLNESQLVEPDGVTGFGPAIDWNDDGVETDTVAKNINCELSNAFFCGPQARQPQRCGNGSFCYDASCQFLQDYDDWGNLQLNQLFDGDFAPREVIHCLLDQ